MYGSVATPTDSQKEVNARSVNKHRTTFVFLSLVAIAATAVVSMSSARPSFLRENSSKLTKSSSDKQIGLSQEIRKKLAAHPTHVDTFSTQSSPVNPGHQSDYSEISITLTKYKDSTLPTFSDDDSRWHFTTELFADDSNAPTIVAHVGQYRSQYSNWILMASQPGSDEWKIITPTHETENDFAVGYILYDSAESKPQPGLWKIYLSAIPNNEVDTSLTKLSADRIFIVSPKSNLHLHTVAVSQDNTVGNNAIVESYFIDKYAYSVDVTPDVLSSIKVTKSFASVVAPDGSKKEFEMVDDNSDGKYTLYLPLEQSGTYQLRVSLLGEVVDTGLIVKRTQSIDVYSVDSSCYYSLVDKVTAEVSTSYPDYYDIHFGVKVPGESDTSKCDKDTEYFSDLHLQAEVWAEDVNGDMKPVTWISGMVLPNVLDNKEGMWYSLSTHKQWFGQMYSRGKGRISLKNVKLLDRQYHIPVSKIDSIDVSVNSYLEYPVKDQEIEEMFLFPSESNFENDLYLSMVHGPKPQADVYLPVNQLSTSLTLFLSHGYCASTTWPVSDFTDAYLFDSGLNEGVSTDRFARELLQYSILYGTKNEFSFIGHSQGGLAGLQLYTYYWSGLDWKSKGYGRKIQAMASPYRGSPIMIDSLADILYDIFGYSCGAVPDISITGAHHWLTTIPKDRRSVVYYYNVFPGYEDCSWYEFWCTDESTNTCYWLTDLLLKDYNDGACNDDLNNLPGATGDSGNPQSSYCHTDTMSYTACYDWTTNNEDMDSKAARP